MAEPTSHREQHNDNGEIMRRLDELARQRRRFVSAASAVAIFRAAPAIDAGCFRADLDAWLGPDLSSVPNQRPALDPES